MGIIHVLDKSVSELIAAGEVVERPSSAIKELVENSIDAGATAITVEIQKGGMSFMRVTDNGCGFYPEDVKNAFLRHATSKVQKAEDLDGIATMGFRGEALASISAVSRVELLSRREGAVEGVRYMIDASEHVLYESAGCPVGTTIFIRDLFYNTPARLKFLKKDVSEANAVTGIVEKIALVYPHISFRLIRDGEEKLHTPGDGQQLSAIYAVFGRDFASGLLPVNYTMNGLSVKGFVSKPHRARANRSMQNFYVNRRYVKSRTCAAALEEGFKHALMVGKFPACVLELSIPPQSVDVNVHPAKIEVRFENEKPIFDLVYFGVKNALHTGDVTVEGVLGKTRVTSKNEQTAQERMSARRVSTYLDGEFLPESAGKREITSSVFQRLKKQTKKRKIFQLFSSGFLEDGSSKWLSFASSPQPTPLKRETESLEKSKVYSPDYWKKSQVLDIEVEDAFSAAIWTEKRENLPASPQEDLASGVTIGQKEQEDMPEQQVLASSEEPYENLCYIGEIFHTYILFEGENRLVVVDKHAAHERILYNRLKRGKPEQFMQNLLRRFLCFFPKKNILRL